MLCSKKMILPSKFNVKLQKKNWEALANTLPPPYGHVWGHPKQQKRTPLIYRHFWLKMKTYISFLKHK
jgi:hypothetical protein